MALSGIPRGGVMVGTSCEVWSGCCWCCGGGKLAGRESWMCLPPPCETEGTEVLVSRSRERDLSFLIVRHLGELLGAVRWKRKSCPPPWRFVLDVTPPFPCETDGALWWSIRIQWLSWGSWTPSPCTGLGRKGACQVLRCHTPPANWSWGWRQWWRASAGPLPPCWRSHRQCHLLLPKSRNLLLYGDLLVPGQEE